ncbi:hypothetical protein M3Y95_00985900 [Aphelenchoides besseyi]|nr:hypothetical protein M3Y95_00985900 [Aphelenchoides besseyi]
MSLSECEIGRYFLAPLTFIVSSTAIVGQIALIWAIERSDSHRRNVSYQTMLIIGFLNLLQLILQFHVSINMFACRSISSFLDRVVSALACRMTICTIEVYNLILALNRVMIMLMPKSYYDHLNVLHSICNYTIWLVNIPIWIAVSHPTCSPFYAPYNTFTPDECVHEKFLLTFDVIRDIVFAFNFFIYIILLIGLDADLDRFDFQHLKYKSTNSLYVTECRILLNLIGQFINLGVLMVLTVYFVRFIEHDLIGRICFRLLRTWYPICNVLLPIVLDKPLRQKLLMKRTNNFNSSVTALNRPQTFMKKKTVE